MGRVGDFDVDAAVDSVRVAVPDMVEYLSRETGEAPESLNTKFEEALGCVSRAAKILIANGITPGEEHSRLAFAWAKGLIDDESFLLFARIASGMLDD